MYCNEAFAKNINKTIDEIIGKTVWDILDYNLASQFSELDKKILETKQSFNDLVYLKISKSQVETVNLLKFPLLDKETKEVQYIVAVYQLLTKQFTADEIFRETELLYLNLLEHLPIGIIVLREKDLAIVEANSFFLKQKNLDLDQVLFKPVNEIDICSNKSRLMELLRDAKESKFPQKFEDYNFLPSGRKIITLLQIENLSIQNSEPLYLLTFSDVSPLYEANEKIFSYLRKEEELKILRNRFISLLGHEIRTPLTAILLSVELIQKIYDKLSPEEKKKHFDRIRNSILSITKLIENSIQIERFIQDKYILQHNKIPLKKYLEDLVEKNTILFNFKNKVILNVDQYLEFETDEVLFNLIINNLLNNAFKYSPFERPIYFDVYTKEDKVIFKIKNFGEPIAKEDLPNIFIPFFRGGNSGFERGHGLGLAIVKRAVDTLEGTIRVESSLETGTIFTILLPNLKSVKK